MEGSPESCRIFVYESEACTHQSGQEMRLNFDKIGQCHSF